MKIENLLHYITHTHMYSMRTWWVLFRITHTHRC